MRAIKPVVYLAGPYSKPDPVENMNIAINLASDLLDDGEVTPICPHLTGAWHLVKPRPYQEWLAYDLAVLERCDAVYRFGGESSGADAEVAHAVAVDVPVFFNLDDLRHWAVIDFQMLVERLISEDDA